MVKPLRDGRSDIADSYREILTDSANLSLHEIDGDTAAKAAQLRSNYSWLRTPDAIQLAVAMGNGADVIVTNDEKWKRISELPVLLLKDYLLSLP